MKLLALTCLSWFSIVMSHAQPWRDLLPPDKSPRELTFFDYQKAFNAYWEPYQVVDGYFLEDGLKVKAGGWKQFKRWEYWMSFRIDPHTGTLPSRTALDVSRDYFATHPPKRSVPADWKSIGPTVTPGGHEGLGRLNCVAFHPTDTLTYWAGAASGGLWMTRDNGSTWRCLTDDNESMGVSDIIIPVDFDISNTIYIATGDRDAVDNNSVGVLKSLDGGLSWIETGLHFELAERKVINRLLMHPTDPRILIAAVSDGVFRTMDGGDTWDDVLTDRAFIDMEFHPGDPSVLYGSTFDGEVYRSQNSGENWVRTLFAINAGRTEMAVTPDEPNWVYAVGVTGGLEGVYRSVDSGATFEKVFDGETLNLMHWDASGQGSGGQGSYDLAVAASPLDAALLFIGGVNTWRSTDAGFSWQLVNHFAGSIVQTVHADKHNLRFHPGGALWECNDGGLYVTKDQGTTWIDKTNGMAISQMYKLGVSASESDVLITGLQDNGSKMFALGSWQHVNGGDGMECMIHPANADIQYSTTQSGSLFRTLDRWNSARYVKPSDAGAGNWVTPYAMDPEDPDIIYGGFREVWKTTDRGDTWTKVSSIDALSKLNCIAIAPSDHQIVYVAESARMWRSVTGGEPFEKINLFGTNISQISSIAVKHNDPQTVWVTASGYWSPGVFQSVDGGDTWEDISEGLPPIPVYTIVENKQAAESIELYAGTELGVFIKKGNDDWVPFNTGLPNVIVSELEFYYSPQPAQSLLRASTYGRGAWETRVAFNSFPMIAVSAEAVHSTLEPINPGSLLQEMIKIEIVTTGDLEPMRATQFIFSTEGSSAASADITAARLFFTGHINGFITTAPVGEVIQSPDGTFEITLDQVLNSGSNYFWLVYDISTDAVIGDMVDGTCINMQLNNEDFPVTQLLAGARSIELIYCDAGSTLFSQEHITHVVSGDVDQVSQKGAAGYDDHTGQVIVMTIGAPHPIAVTNSAPHNTNELLIWADWNRDGDFSDDEELLYKSGPLGISTYSTAITPPAHARIGLTRMRIRLHDTSFGPNAAACGVSNLGEVEDFTIDVQKENTTLTPALIAVPMQLKPNPVSDNMVITIAPQLDPLSIDILNALGHRIYAGNILDELILDVRTWVPDIYFVRIRVGNLYSWSRFAKM